MIPILSPKEIKRVEKKYLIKSNNKSILQHRAARGISQLIIEKNPSAVFIFFGPGMNGRDGLIAGKLIQKEIGSENVQFVSCIEKNSSNKNLIFSKNESIPGAPTKIPNNVPITDPNNPIKTLKIAKTHQFGENPAAIPQTIQPS